MTPYLMAVAVTSAIALMACGAVVLLRQRKNRVPTALSPALQGQPSALVRPAALARERRPAPAAGSPTEIARIVGLTMREAEDLLDWLEQNGYPDRGLACEMDRFTVEFRVDAGHGHQAAPHGQAAQTIPEPSAP